MSVRRDSKHVNLTIEGNKFFLKMTFMGQYTTLWETYKNVACIRRTPEAHESSPDEFLLFNPDENLVSVLLW